MQPELLTRRIQEEKAAIRVDSYQDIAFKGGWKGGARMLWSVGAAGGLTGAGIGLVAPIFPVLAGATGLAAAIAAIPASIAVFASTGMAMGVAAGTMTGRASGSAAAVAEEQERRMQGWAVEAALKQNPKARVDHDTHEKQSPSIKLRYINPKVGLAFAALGAVAGLVMAGAFLASGGTAGAVMPALGALTGMGSAIAANGTVVVAYTVGVMATFGAIFGINYPKILNDMNHVTGDLLSGKTLNAPWEEKAAATPQHMADVQQTATPQLRADQVQETPKRPHLNREKHGSYEELLALQAARHAAEQLGKG